MTFPALTDPAAWAVDVSPDEAGQWEVAFDNEVTKYDDEFLYRGRRDEA